MKKDLRGTWRQALLTFFGPVLMLLAVRWALVEPFVIPSGSMIPSLLIHDHIFVNKLSFGVHWPFGRSFIAQWSHPKAGQVVVFRYPENPDIFYVKRVVAVSGDEISVNQGVISVNGKPYPQQPFTEQKLDEDFEYFKETSNRTYVVRYRNKDLSHFHSVKVPENSFFVMGDNRDQSADSRFWGFATEESLIGTAQLIWLSCEETLQSAPFLCSPTSIRWDRLLKKVQ